MRIGSNAALTTATSIPVPPEARYVTFFAAATTSLTSVELSHDDTAFHVKALIAAQLADKALIIETGAASFIRANFTTSTLSCSFSN